MPPRNNRRHRLHHWHRYLGLFAGLFTLWITLSGIALNHSAELELDQQHTPNNWALTSLNSQPPAMTAYKTAQHWIIQLNGRLYRDTQEVATHSSQLIGAVSLQQMLVIATTDSLWLFDHSGQLIEQIDWSIMLPALPEKVAITPEERLIIQTGKKWYGSDDVMFSWQPVTEQNFHIVQPGQPPEEITQQLNEHYSSRSMNHEQLLLNLHTGRIFGKYGIYLIDLIAIILATLAISGFTVWLRRVRF